MRRIDDLVAYQFAVEFKLEVYRIVNESADAQHAYKYKDQLLDAASGIEACLAEGFARFLPGEFGQFIRYALGSLGEAETRLGDGVARGYFLATTCATALTWGRRCRGASRALLASQRRRLENEKRQKDAVNKRRRSHTGDGTRER